MPKAKGYLPQFGETAREQALERALRKRMLAKGKTHKQIIARKKARGFLSDAEQKFNKRTRRQFLSKGATKREANQQLKALKLNKGKLPKKIKPRDYTDGMHPHPFPERQPGPRIPNPKGPGRGKPRLPERIPTGEGRIPNPKKKAKIPNVPGNGRSPGLPRPRGPHMPEMEGRMPRIPNPKNPWKRPTSK